METPPERYIYNEPNIAELMQPLIAKMACLEAEIIIIEEGEPSE